jgi:hypothetical protein
MQIIPEYTTSSTLTRLYQFIQQTLIKEIPFSSTTLDTSNVTEASYAFYYNRILKELPSFDFPACINAIQFAGVNTIIKKINPLTFPLLQQADSFFNSNHLLEDIPEIDFPEVIDAYGMFQYCYSLKSHSISVPKATRIDNLFYNNRGTRRVHVDAPLATTGSNAFNSQAWYGWGGIEQVSGDLSSMGSNQNFFQYTPQLKKLLITINDNLTIQQLNMSGKNLDDLYTYLPTVTGKTINITNNRGRTEDDPSIATAKGWTVTG